LHRRFLALGILTCSLGLVLTGCQKSADEAANSDNSTESAASSSSSKAASSAAKTIAIPAETPITIVLDETLGSKTSSTGQNFSASLRTPVEINGRVIIPKGAHVTGIVRDAKSAGRFKGGAELAIALTGVNIDGKDYEIHTNTHTLVTKGKGKRTAVMVGGGGAVGALIGGLAGGGKGAAIGAAVGAGGGAAGAGLTGDREITLPAETPVTFKLTDPLEIRVR
jgi:hypothetical protein